MNKKAITSNRKGRDVPTQQTNFDLSKYNKLTVEFKNHRGKKEFSFEFSRTHDDTPTVHFRVTSRPPQTLVINDVMAAPELQLKIRKATITMPKGKDFDVYFTSDGHTHFAVQIDGDMSESLAWFNVYDSSGNEVSALCLMNSGGES